MPTIRKLQGSDDPDAAFYVYLPIAWVRAAGMKKGDELLLQDLDDGSLLVQKASKVLPKQDAAKRAKGFKKLGTK